MLYTPHERAMNFNHVLLGFTPNHWRVVVTALSRLPREHAKREKVATLPEVACRLCTEPTDLFFFFPFSFLSQTDERLAIVNGCQRDKGWGRRRVRVLQAGRPLALVLPSTDMACGNRGLSPGSHYRGRK